MKCRHDNLEIVEYGTATTVHHRIKGEWHHWSDTGDYAGKVWVKCRDCGLNREYTKNKPKWLVNIIKIFSDM